MSRSCYLQFQPPVFQMPDSELEQKHIVNLAWNPITTLHQGVYSDVN